ncbi:hypothetical protein BJ684DRAFT_18600 [Piptocephalis cylindrospora]|uniref:Uncharacterized protein n=1 Tax=Piptocephalis cylindrospora TaxID=1907219 RepID=A0A4P9Y9F4_9FUNG|nr:hypothetical protein BJ684DRAFT_18600 [Piptocephalis cylindrospora]|eukprot:RKP15051.1 hypothetical protein BJ684DRAFT_18600 [Piptocephalis cylindrospora]
MHLPALPSLLALSSVFAAILVTTPFGVNARHKMIPVNPWSVSSVCSGKPVLGLSYSTTTFPEPISSILVLSQSATDDLMAARRANSTTHAPATSCFSLALGCDPNGSYTCSNSMPSGQLMEPTKLCLLFANDLNTTAVNVNVTVDWLTEETQTTLYHPHPDSEECLVKGVEKFPHLASWLPTSSGDISVQSNLSSLSKIAERPAISSTVLNAS